MSWQTVYKYGYGICKLHPLDLYKMTVNELLIMTQNIIEYEREDVYLQYEQLAWQTSLLMNATGNYKKRIKPTDLFDRDKIEEKESDEGTVRKMDRDDKNRKLEDLMNKFNQ